jgi:hypothetical protein
MGLGRMGFRHAGAAKVAVALVLFAGLAGCSAGSLLGSEPEANPAPTPAPAGEPETDAAAAAPPPVDLAGRWQLSAAAGGACFMTFGKAAGNAAAAAPQGTIAPEGGCPANFFMSRKWAFEHGMLIIRDFKGRQLAQLSYLGAHFEGQDASGSALTLSKQM